MTTATSWLCRNGELDALLAELRDQLVSFFRGAHPRDVGAEGLTISCPTPSASPPECSGPPAGKQAAQHVALRQRQLAVVGQHHSRRRVPGDDAPSWRCGQSPDMVKASSTRCSRGVISSVTVKTRLRRMAKGENKQMLALRGGQPQTAGDPLQHLAGRRPTAPLFKPGIPGRADAGELRDLFAAQPGVTPASRREAKRCRIETLAAGARKSPKAWLSEVFIICL